MAPYTNSSLSTKSAHRGDGTVQPVDVHQVSSSLEKTRTITAETDMHDGKATKRLLWKIDRRLLPVLAAIYAFALIDRVNLPNARIAGMDEDLQLSVGERYSILTSMFFVTYIIFQFPANIIIRKVGAALWLSSLVILWGVVSLGMGFTARWDQLLGCRLILGALEAGFFPGCVFLLSCWYVRYEIQTRFSAFYLLAILATGISNILAYGLSLMKGVGGLNGWKWIFIIEGIITCLLGFLGFFIIIDFPDKATQPGLIIKKSFLTQEEADLVLARVNADRGDAAPENLAAASILHHLGDWKLWEYSWLYLLNTMVAYAFAYFLHIILHNGLGFSTTLSQVLSFPPYALAAVWMFIAAWISDHYHHRGGIIIFNSAMTIVGVAMMGFLSGASARYAGAFIGVASSNSNIPALLSYQHNNIVGQSKRAFASALLVGGGGVGGIVASNIFRQQDAPRYLPALYTILGTQAVTILHILKNFGVYSRANSKAARGETVIEGQEGFRYTL